MSVQPNRIPVSPAAAAPHPNDVDRKRIERALACRERYRYVSPSVRAVTGGYRIESACCSRNIDPTGGVVDIALLQYVPGRHAWQLYRRDHATRQWKLYDTYDRLSQLLERLNTDPERIFWQ